MDSYLKKECLSQSSQRSQRLIITPAGAGVEKLMTLDVRRRIETIWRLSRLFMRAAQGKNPSVTSVSLSERSERAGEFAGILNYLCMSVWACRGVAHGA